MSKSSFHYLDGQEMQVGDRVLIEGKFRAHVEQILIPGTPVADGLGCGDRPKFLLRYEDGGLVEEDSTDYDLVLLSRANK